MKRFERIRGPCGWDHIDSTGGLNLLKNVGKYFQLGDFGRFLKFYNNCIWSELLNNRYFIVWDMYQYERALK